MVLVFVTAALMGGNYVALKEALAHTTPIALTAMRAVLGGTTLLVFARLRGERVPRSRQAWTAIGAVSTCITTVSSVLLVLGTKRVPSGVAALLSATMPLCAAGLSVLVLAERPDRQARVGLAIGVGGAAVLASPALAGDTSLLGVALLLAATTAWATGVVVQKRLDVGEVSAVMFVACQLLVSAVVVGLVALVVEGIGGIDVGWGLVVPLGYSAIPAMAIPFSLIATVIRRAPAVQGAAVAYLIPLFGVLASWLVRGETLAVAELAGGALVIVGVVLVNRPRA
jgi:drug/metabolite transporter (DMT)-like permease